MAWRVPRMTAEEGAAWLGLVGLLELLPPALDAQLQRDAHLTHFEFIVLSNLRFAGAAGMRAKDLAAATSTTPARLSHVVARLVDRDALERVAEEGDRRGARLRLSPTGRRVLVRATAAHIDFVRTTVIDRLTPAQIGELAAITRAITAGLDPGDRTGHLRRPGDGRPA